MWNIPSIFSLAESAGVSWAAFPDADGYPTKYYTSLTNAPGTDNIHPPSQFIPMAKAGTLPQICYVWSPAGYDEHPPATSNPDYVTNGQDLVWQRVQAVIDGGGWPDTTFILTWDDWGGYADSVPTPDVETAVDALHPDGFQVIGGSRIPLIMFGGKVVQGIDSRWHSHACIPKTIIDLLGLPPLGVPRVDTAVSLADRVDPTSARPTPPAHGNGDHPAGPSDTRLRRLSIPARGPGRPGSRCPTWSRSTAAAFRPPPTPSCMPSHRSRPRCRRRRPRQGRRRHPPRRWMSWSTSPTPARTPTSSPRHHWPR